MKISKPVDQDPEIPSILKIFIIILGLATCFMGLMVMYGWMTHNAALVRISPKLSAMKFNTALGFYWSGIVLSLLFHRSKALLRILSVLIVFLGATVLIEYVFKGVKFHLNELFVKDYWPNGGDNGRMAIQTAFCFFVFGSCFLIDLCMKNKNAVQFYRCFWGAFLLIVGFTAIFGFVFNIRSAYTWKLGIYGLHVWAVHTAIGFILLGLGLLLTAYRKYYLPLIVVFLGGVTLAVQTYYGLSFIKTAKFKVMIPPLLFWMIICFTIFTVFYIYTQMRRRITIEKIVVQRTEQIRRSEERLKIATQGGGIGVWDWDIPNNILLWDELMCKLYGINKESFVGTYDYWQDMLHPQDLPQWHKEIQQALKGEKEFNTEFRIIWPDETVHYIKASGLITRDSEGRAVRMVGMSWDMTENNRLKEELFKLSTYDELTGLYNRRGFKLFVEQRIKESKRSKKPIILLLMDLNHMKQINDKLGHTAGDMALMDTAAVLKKSFRETDIICRWGGDEFVVLGVDTTADNVAIIKKRFQDNLKEYNLHTDRGFKLSISVGEVISDCDSLESLERLIIEADKKMYEDKVSSKAARSSQEPPTTH